MSFGKIVKELTEFITGEAIIGAMEQVKGQVEETTAKVIKALVLYVMFLIGMIFLLVGLANYLQARFIWMEGMGLIIVGVIIIGLGFFAKSMR